MASIQEHLNKIKNAVFGKDVRNSIHDGLYEINKETETTSTKQEKLEKTFNDLIINSGNSNAEVAAARNGFETLGKRLDGVDSQLDTIANKGTTVEVLERVTKEEIERQIADGTMANLTIADGSITQEKLKDDQVSSMKIVDGNNINKLNEILKYLKLKHNLRNNLLDIPNKDILTTNTPYYEFVTSETNFITSFIPVTKGQTIKSTVGGTLIAFNKDKEWNKQIRVNIGESTVYNVLNDGFIVCSFPNNTNPVVYDSTSISNDVDFKYVFENLEVNTSQLIGDIKFKNEDWFNIFEDGFLKKSGYWSTDNATLDFTDEVTKLNIDTSYAFPTFSGLYKETISSNKKYAVFFDFTINSCNFSSCKLGVRINNTDVDFAFKSFLPLGNQKGVYIISPKKDVTWTQIAFNFRDFIDLNENNKKLNISINNIMLIELKGHLLEYSESEILNNILYRNENANGEITSTRSIEHSEKSSISNESYFLRTGWYRKKICTFGDSTIAQERWQPYMAKRLGCTYTNRGIGGTCWEIKEGDNLSENDIWKNETSFTTDNRINTIDADADALVVFGGFNDYDRFKSVPFNLENTITNDSDWNFNPNNMQGAISLFIRKVRAINPKMKILIACMPFGFEDISRGTTHKIRSAMKEACEINCVDFIDMYALCQWNSDNWKEYHKQGENDSIHFDNTDGAKIIAGIICDALMKYEPWN